MPEAEFLDTDVDADKLAVLDTMVNSLETADVALVDNRASGGTKVLRYIEDSRLTELAKANSISSWCLSSSLSRTRTPFRRSPICWTNIMTACVGSSSGTTVIPQRITMYDGSQDPRTAASHGNPRNRSAVPDRSHPQQAPMCNLTVSKGCTSPLCPPSRPEPLQTFHQAMAAQFDKAKGVILP